MLVIKLFGVIVSACNLRVINSQIHHIATTQFSSWIWILDLDLCTQINHLFAWMVSGYNHNNFILTNKENFLEPCLILTMIFERFISFYLVLSCRLIFDMVYVFRMNSIMYTILDNVHKVCMYKWNFNYIPTWYFVIIARFRWITRKQMRFKNLTKRRCNNLP